MWPRRTNVKHIVQFSILDSNYHRALGPNGDLATMVRNRYTQAAKWPCSAFSPLGAETIVHHGPSDFSAFAISRAILETLTAVAVNYIVNANRTVGRDTLFVNNFERS